MARHTARKLRRRALKLSAFHYFVEHLPGERNVVADMLTRREVQSNTTEDATKIPRAKSLMRAPMVTAIGSVLDWPTREDVKNSQAASAEKTPKRFKKRKDRIQNDRGVLWIPVDDVILKLRIIIAEHTGLGGHWSWPATLATVRSHFVWHKMSDDVESFVRSCLHCLCTETGKIILRPLDHALYAMEPNKLLHFDFCSMSPGEKRNIYVLVLKDDHISYIRLVTTNEETAEVAATALIDWFATFGVVQQ